MKKSNLTAHMMIKNEEQWVWYAIASIIDWVDEIIIFDTGSTDNSKKIIQTFKSAKISYLDKGSQNRQDLVTLRNKMSEITKTDWFMLVDGDEVWPKSSLKLVIDSVRKAKNKTWGFVVRTRNCVGDISHYLPESAGNYQLLGKKGHLTVRIIRKIPGYNWIGEYPLKAYTDQQGHPIQNHPRHLKFLDTYYWHLTHLPRSSKSSQVIDRDEKYKLELGELAKKQYLPEVFFKKRPQIVPSPFVSFSDKNKLKASLLTPFKKIRRKIKS